MARYNTILTSQSASTTAAVNTPSQGQFYELTGSGGYVVTIADPTLYNGQSQTFYNASSGSVTLQSSNGSNLFKGPGGSNSNSYTLQTIAMVTFYSDGQYWIVGQLGGSSLTAASLAMSGDITTTATSTNLLNSTTTTLNIGGAATTLVLGATTGTASINNATVTLANATQLNINGASPALVSSSATVSIFNSGTTTINLGAAATTVAEYGAVTSLSIGNTTAAQTVNMFTASTGASTYNFATGGTTSGTTKAVNLGTGGASGSTTNVFIGSGNGGTTTINGNFSVGLKTTMGSTSYTGGGASSSLYVSGDITSARGASSGVIFLGSNGSNYLYFDGTNHNLTASLLPTSNNSYDLGTSSNRWRTIYTTDLELSNGIGDYTVVEGEEDLFIYNNKNGKTYKFMLQEVDKSVVPAKKAGIPGAV
jgi:hypothetical protein